MEWTSTTAMLERLARRKTGAFEPFKARFCEPLEDFFGRLGSGPEFARAAALDSLHGLAKELRRAQGKRDPGPLKDRLFRIAFGQGRRRGLTGLEARASALRHWDRAWKDHALRCALERARSECTVPTMRAFERFGLEGIPAEQVARELGIDASAVVLAQQRVLRRVRAYCRDLEGRG